ncbi:MAG: pentapeptide repeat-containing protein [Alphaproteobacteria bacterium]
MQHFKLFEYKNSTEIFSGYFESFRDCLEEAIIKNKDLSNVNLKNKDLSNANLDNASMPGAVFINTNLSGANLSEANLENSIFYNCSLYNTCLSFSNLQSCDFRNANFGATLIDNSDMSNCIFSTLSCFDLDFHFTKNMSGSIFVSDEKNIHQMSKHPMVLKGFLNTHIIIFDNSIKIGMRTFPKSMLPDLINVINLSAKHSSTNDNTAIQEKLINKGKLA